MGLLSFDPRLLAQMQMGAGGAAGAAAQTMPQAGGQMGAGMMQNPMMQMGQQLMGASQPQQQGSDALQMQSLAFRQQQEQQEAERRRRMGWG